MNLAKTRYKIYGGKLLVLIKTLKIRWHPLINCKYEVFILINNNNLSKLIYRKFSSFSLMQ